MYSTHIYIIDHTSVCDFDLFVPLSAIVSTGRIFSLCNHLKRQFLTPRWPFKQFTWQFFNGSMRRLLKALLLRTNNCFRTSALLLLQHTKSEHICHIFHKMLKETLETFTFKLMSYELVYVLTSQKEFYKVYYKLTVQWALSLFCSLCSLIYRRNTTWRTFQSSVLFIKSHNFFKILSSILMQYKWHFHKHLHHV